MTSALITPLAIALYIATGLTLARLAAQKAYNYDGSRSRSDIENRTYIWLWLTLFLWPLVLAAAVPFYVGRSLGRIIHRIALPQELSQ